MTDSGHLIPLLHGADWTRWSLGGTVVIQRPYAGRGGSRTSYRLIVAPGGRYRYEPVRDPGTTGQQAQEQVSLIVCDGTWCWVIVGDEGSRSLADAFHTPMDEIVRPSWLLASLRLEVRESTRVNGRAAWRVHGTPRRLAGDPEVRDSRADGVDLLIDAELGVVLRLDAVAAGKPLATLELREFTVDPPQAADPATFLPPPEAEIDEDDLLGYPADFGPEHRDGQGDIGLDWALAHEAPFGLAGAAVRVIGWNMALREPARDTGTDDDAAMPAAEATPPRRDAPSDSTLNLIARTGLPEPGITAQVHHWSDKEVVARGIGVPLTSAGEFHRRVALGLFATNGLPRVRSFHRTALLRVAASDRYRIEFGIDDRRGQPEVIACDGLRSRKEFRNRVVACSPEPLPREFADLLEPAWLLSGWQLAQAGHDGASGRDCVVLTAEPFVHTAARTWALPTPRLHAVVWLDAELGIVLRLVSYVNDEPAVRFELRDMTIASQEEPGDFDIASDRPLIESDGLLHDLDLPAPVIAAADATAAVLSGLRSGLQRLWR